MNAHNLFEGAAPPDVGERFETILRERNVVVERIVSGGKVVPVEYEQEQDEWVLLLTGEARLNVAGRAVSLKAGDHLFLPARTPHTVEQVSAGATWLAVHIHPN